MGITKIDLKDLGKFSSLFLDYLDEDTKLEPFYEHSPRLKSFESIVHSKKYPSKFRKTLYSSLNDQYSNIIVHQKVRENIQLLEGEGTFSITTGHQLCLFTGPLFFVYKVLTTINICERLKDIYPRYNFVPIYWLASEDHDIDEIRSVQVFSKKFTWNTLEEGATGELSTEGIDKIKELVPDLPDMLCNYYGESKDLAEATIKLVNELFGEYGLVSIDANNKELKRLFLPIIKNEILDQRSNVLLEAQTRELESLGYKGQLKGREINLFFKQSGSRKRIVQNGELLETVDKEPICKVADLDKFLEDNIECFSPNAVLRPVYEELILPNLAYVGGPGELAYWLQLKGVFELYEVDFPVLMPRSFATIIGAGVRKKMNKIKLELDDLFADRKRLERSIANVDEKVSFSSVYEIIDQLEVSILDQVMEVDKSLEGNVKGEMKKLGDRVKGIEKRLEKAVKQQSEADISKLNSILESLLPGGGLQERIENLFTFYINDANFIHWIKENLDPFDYRMHFFIYE